MKNKLFSLVLITVILLAGLVALRFFAGGEDNWICSDGQWVKHGNPKSSKPGEGCGQDPDWQEQVFSEAGLTLSFKMPPDMTYRKEIAEDIGRIRVASFYVEKGDKNNPTYQLYAVYQPQDVVTDNEFARTKTGMSPNTIKEVTIDGYQGIEGLVEISGPKSHYLTFIGKDGKPFSVSTYPPTVENKELTDKIISTFNFQ